MRPKEKRSVSERLIDGQSKVNDLMSFIDWVRYVFDWIKGLFGR